MRFPLGCSPSCYNNRHRRTKPGGWSILLSSIRIFFPGRFIITGTGETFFFVGIAMAFPVLTLVHTPCCCCLFLQVYCTLTRVEYHALYME